MKERTKAIFEASLGSFIKTGRPITSELLYDSYDFGIKPAMIRWELNALNDAGYFYQTHPSGGRYPTNKAYRFFVDELLAEGLNGTFANVRQVMRGFLEGEMKSFIAEVADYLKVLSVGYEPNNREMYESGFESLLRQLEVGGKRELLKVVKDFEYLPERLSDERKWWQKEQEWPQVFIGGSPVTKSEYLSLIVDRLDVDNEKFLLIAIGPKRMDYKKSLNLFKSIERTLA